MAHIPQMGDLITNTTLVSGLLVISKNEVLNENTRSEIYSVVLEDIHIQAGYTRWQQFTWAFHWPIKLKQIR